MEDRDIPKEETVDLSLQTSREKSPSKHSHSSEGSSLSPDNPQRCRVCGLRAKGTFFGVLTCLACKSFFIRYRKVGESELKCEIDGNCSVDRTLRRNCAYCRYKKCLKVGMRPQERSSKVVFEKGQKPCMVCEDIATGIHFGVLTCGGCTKFFRRTIRKGAGSTYKCYNFKRCVINPRTRNKCPRCRFDKCLQLGMSRKASKLGRPRKILNIIPEIEEDTPYQEEGQRENIVTFTMSAHLGDIDILIEKGSQNVDTLSRIINSLIKTGDAKRRVLSMLSYATKCPIPRYLPSPSRDERDNSIIKISFNLTKNDIIALINSMEKHTQAERQPQGTNVTVYVPASGRRTGYGTNVAIPSISSTVSTLRSSIDSTSAQSTSVLACVSNPFLRPRESYSGWKTCVAPSASILTGIAQRYNPSAIMPSPTAGWHVPSASSRNPTSEWFSQSPLVRQSPHTLRFSPTWHNRSASGHSFLTTKDSSKSASQYSSIFSTISTQRKPAKREYNPTSAWDRPISPEYRPFSIRETRTSPRYSPTFIRYSPAPTRHSPISRPFSPISTRESRSSARHSSTFIQYSPVLTRHSPILPQYSPISTRESRSSTRYGPTFMRHSSVSARRSPIPSRSSTRHSPISSHYSPISARYNPDHTRHSSTSACHSPMTSTGLGPTSKEYSPTLTLDIPVTTRYSPRSFNIEMLSKRSGSPFLRSLSQEPGQNIPSEGDFSPLKLEGDDDYTSFYHPLEQSSYSRTFHPFDEGSVQLEKPVTDKGGSEGIESIKIQTSTPESDVSEQRIASEANKDFGRRF